MALARLPTGERLQQEVLRAGPHVLYVLRQSDGPHVVGAVLHGRPGQALPGYVLPKRRARSRRSQGTAQLDLFAML